MSRPADGGTSGGSGNDRLLRAAPLAASFLVLLLGLLALAVEPGPVVQVRNSLFDAYQRAHPRAYEPVPVRVVDIDDDSLARLGQWPWPRDQVALLIARLLEAGAAVVALDIVFAEPDRTAPARVLAPWRDRPEVAALADSLPDPDAVLGEVIAGGGVVVGLTLNQGTPPARFPALPARFIESGDDPRPHLFGNRGAVTNLAVIEERAAGIGTFSFTHSPDGVIRKVPLLLRLRKDDGPDVLVPSLAVEALRVALGERNIVVRSNQAGDIARGLIDLRLGSLTIPADAHGEAWLHYTRPQPARSVPAWAVLDGSALAAAIRDSLVFIGTSAQGLQDLRVSPLGIMPGVMAHAELAEQALLGAFLERPLTVKASEALFLILGWLLLAAMVGRLNAVGAALVALALVGGAAWVSWYAFTGHRTLLDPVVPGTVLLLAFLAHLVPRALIEERRHRWVRDAFSRYVSPNLVEHLIAHPDQLDLGGEMRDCSFVMTDLGGFTTFMETVGPQQVVSVLNDYLDGMVRIAFAHGGTLDRFVGDAVAVIFSAPVTLPDHAARAVACALEMDAFARAFAAARQAEGIPFGVTRIGVHSGPVLVGNFGGRTMFDYRALGDPINTASRLESVNKHLGTLLCVSGDTVERCGAGFSGRPVGTLVLKGKSQGIAAFEPLPAERLETPEVAAYRTAFAALEAGDAAQADALFAGLPDDPLARFHRARLARGEHGTTVVLAEK